MYFSFHSQKFIHFSQNKSKYKNKQQKAVNKKKMARKQLTRKSKKWLA